MKISVKNSVATKAKLFRGLGDRSRLSIVESLRSGPSCVSDIIRATGLSQALVSMHLACMRCWGVVASERRGRFIYYRLASKDVVKLLKQAEAILRRVASNVSKCPRYSR